MRAALFLLLALGGCTSLQTVTKVPVPVRCDVDIPERPIMPTEVLPMPTLDAKVAALLSEIDTREAYELRLRAGLEGCTVQRVVNQGKG